MVKEETVAQLDDGPMQWKQIDKKKKARTEALNAKMIAESMEVRRASDKFQGNVDAFSDHFNAVAPFNVAGGVLDLTIVRCPLVRIRAI